MSLPGPCPCICHLLWLGTNRAPALAFSAAVQPKLRDLELPECKNWNMSLSRGGNLSFRDKFGWQWFHKAHVSSVNKTLEKAPCFSSSGKELPCFSSCPWPELGFHLQNSLYQKTALRQNLLLVTSLADLGLVRLSPAFQTMGFCAFLPMEKNCSSCPSACEQP